MRYRKFREIRKIKLIIANAVNIQTVRVIFLFFFIMLNVATFQFEIVRMVCCTYVHTMLPKLANLKNKYKINYVTTRIKQTKMF